MANSIDTRLTALEERAEAAEKKAREQHGTIVALQTALKGKGK
jgi:hypothetical protein